MREKHGERNEEFVFDVEDYDVRRRRRGDGAMAETTDEQGEVDGNRTAERKKDRFAMMWCKCAFVRSMRWADRMFRRRKRRRKPLLNQIAYLLDRSTVQEIACFVTLGVDGTGRKAARLNERKPSGAEEVRQPHGSSSFLSENVKEQRTQRKEAIRKSKKRKVENRTLLSEAAFALVSASGQ
jgi:hypothetical protein